MIRAALMFKILPHNRNIQLYNALEKGMKKHGDKLIYYDTTETNCSPKENIRFVIGIKDNKQRVDGIHRFVFDKGYDRKNIHNHPYSEWLHWSIRYMPDWPETRLLFNAPHDRIHTLKMKLLPRKNTGTVITVATSSQKYCDCHNLGNATKYATNIIRQIKEKTNKKIWYRPKPSFGNAVPIKGTLYDRTKGSKAMRKLFNKTYVLITDGSHIGARSVINGVPAITLDGGMGHSVTGHSLNNLEDPYWPSEKKRENWFADIGYSHYSIPEMTQGLAWEVMKQKLQ